MFGQQLQALRARAGLTQEELADRVGVSLERVQRWETGGDEPGSGAVDKLAEALGVPREEVAVGLAESAEVRQNEILTRPRPKPAGR
jgi:transcriptional regulator with XRE-family HTH domain